MHIMVLGGKPTKHMFPSISCTGSLRTSMIAHWHQHEAICVISWHALSKLTHIIMLKTAVIICSWMCLLQNSSCLQWRELALWVTAMSRWYTSKSSHTYLRRWNLTLWGNPCICERTSGNMGYGLVSPMRCSFIFAPEISWETLKFSLVEVQLSAQWLVDPCVWMCTFALTMHLPIRDDAVKFILFL